jgi:hypothetical protein
LRRHIRRHQLLVEETDSMAFAAFYDARADAEWVSSTD